MGLVYRFEFYVSMMNDEETEGEAAIDNLALFLTLITRVTVMETSVTLFTPD